MPYTLRLKNYFHIFTFSHFLILLSLSPGLSLCQNGISVNTTGTAADNSAILDISSTSQGLLIPRMTTAQRDAIVETPLMASLLIFNTSTNCFEAYVNGSWYSISCAPCNPPAAPTPGTLLSTSTSVIWKWNSVNGAAGYKWSTANTYAAANDVGAVLSFTQTGLTCNSSYTLYVWAYNSCGNSGSTALTQSTSACVFTCGSNMVIIHTAGDISPETKTISYGTVLTGIAGTGSKCWITQNLGAVRQATSYSDAADDAAGWYWQFNRKQGFKVGPYPAWNSDLSNYGFVNWDINSDPCNLLLGAGWRLPTYAEWVGVNNSSFGNHANTLFNSPLILHTGGYLHDWTGTANPPEPSGTLDDRNANGYGDGWYWSNNGNDPGNVQGAWGYAMRTFIDYVTPNQDYGKLNALAIRCLKD